MLNEYEEISVSRFKATCLALFKKVARTGHSVLVTRNGKPIAIVSPPPPVERSPSWLGALRGTGKITGDVVAPALDEEDWEALE